MAKCCWDDCPHEAKNRYLNVETRLELLFCDTHWPLRHEKIKEKEK